MVKGGAYIYVGRSRLRKKFRQKKFQRIQEKQRERDERRGEKVVEPDVSTGCNPPTLRHTLNHKYTLRDKLIDTSRPDSGVYLSDNGSDTDSEFDDNGHCGNHDNDTCIKDIQKQEALNHFNSSSSPIAIISKTSKPRQNKMSVSSCDDGFSDSEFDAFVEGRFSSSEDEVAMDTQNPTPPNRALVPLNHASFTLERVTDIEHYERMRILPRHLVIVETPASLLVRAISTHVIPLSGCHALSPFTSTVRGPIASYNLRAREVSEGTLEPSADNLDDIPDASTSALDDPEFSAIEAELNLLVSGGDDDDAAVSCVPGELRGGDDIGLEFGDPYYEDRGETIACLDIDSDEYDMHATSELYLGTPIITPLGTPVVDAGEFDVRNDADTPLDTPLGTPLNLAAELHNASAGDMVQCHLVVADDVNTPNSYGTHPITPTEQSKPIVESTTPDIPIEPCTLRGAPSLVEPVRGTPIIRDTPIAPGTPITPEEIARRKVIDDALEFHEQLLLCVQEKDTSPPEYYSGSARMQASPTSSSVHLSRKYSEIIESHADEDEEDSSGDETRVLYQAKKSLSRKTLTKTKQLLKNIGNSDQPEDKDARVNLLTDAEVDFTVKKPSRWQYLNCCRTM